MFYNISKILIKCSVRRTVFLLSYCTPDLWGTLVWKLVGYKSFQCKNSINSMYPTILYPKMVLLVLKVVFLCGKERKTADLCVKITKICPYMVIKRSYLVGFLYISHVKTQSKVVGVHGGGTMNRIWICYHLLQMAVQGRLFRPPRLFGTAELSCIQ